MARFSFSTILGSRACKARLARLFFGSLTEYSIAKTRVMGGEKPLTRDFGLIDVQRAVRRSAEKNLEKLFSRSRGAS